MRACATSAAQQPLLSSSNTHNNIQMTKGTSEVPMWAMPLQCIARNDRQNQSDSRQDAKHAQVLQTWHQKDNGTIEQRQLPPPPSPPVAACLWTKSAHCAKPCNNKQHASDELTHLMFFACRTRGARIARVGSGNGTQ